MTTEHKYVAKGTYGCVLRPAIPCNKKKLNVPTVSKLFYNIKDANKEWKESNITKDLDPERKFTLSPFSKCYVKHSQIGSEIEKCGDPWNQHDPTPQLVYPDGGIAFSKIPATFDLIDLMKSLTPIIKGLVKLERLGYAHHDIKPDNMVFQPQTKKAYLIDFGLMRPLKNMYSQQNLFILEYKYPYYPIEQTIYSNAHKNIHQNINNLYDFDKTIHNLDLLKHWFYNSKLNSCVPELIDTYSDTYMSNIINEILTTFNDIKTRTKKNRDEIFNKYCA